MTNPLNPARARAYLISNAQVTAGSAGRTLRRPRKQLLTTMRSLVVQGDAIATGPLRALRPLAGNCTAPVQITEAGGTYDRPHLDTLVRCRKCEACLKHRRAVWSARARYMIGSHERTWMVTLTCTADAHYRLLLRAIKRERDKGCDPSEWSSDEEFKRRADEFGKEVTLWLKRVRISGARFSYLMVVEAHKTGLPHVHLLVHESNGCTYRALTSAWRLGFAHAKLVEGPKAALYVTKYLMKSALARVRASLLYGKQPPQGIDRNGRVEKPVSPEKDTSE